MEDRVERHINQFVEAELYKYKINKKLVKGYDSNIKRCHPARGFI